MEEEEVGYTLDDYFADKAASSTGILKEERKVREHEKITEKVQARDADKQRITQIENKLGGRDMHAMKPDANAVLFGFSSQADDDFEDRRGARGGRGRGGRDQPPREPRQGGRKGRGKLVIDDEAFPTL